MLLNDTIILLMNKLYLLFFLPYLEGSPKSTCELRTGVPRANVSDSSSETGLTNELCGGDTGLHVSTLKYGTIWFIMESNMYNM